MARWLIRSAVVAGVCVTIVVVAAISSERYQSHWEEKVIAQYREIKDNARNPPRDASPLNPKPDAIRVSARGSVYLIFRPPAVAWLLKFQPDVYEYETYVLEIETSSGNRPPKVELHHGSE